MSDKLDKAGAAVSMACAIHCAAMPLVVSLLPMIGLTFLADSWVDVGILLVSGTMATIAGVHGYEKHKCIWVPLFFWAAITIIMVGIILHFKTGSEAIAMMPAGGIILCITHIVNIRMSKKHMEHHSHHCDG